MSVLPQDPILSFSEAKEFEEGYFLGDDEKEWDVMNRAGEAVGDSALRDMRELRTIPHRPRRDYLRPNRLFALPRGCVPRPLRTK